MTPFGSLIRLLLEAVTLWLRLQVLEFPERAQIKADETEDQIQNLRATGNPLDALRADRLRDRLARRIGFAQTISTAVNPPPGKSTSPDDGRDLHPANK